MILRYVVEGKFAPTFTASNSVKDREESDTRVKYLEMLNHQEGYMKYSAFILYTDENKIVHKY